MSKNKLQPGRDALQRYLDEIGDTPLMTDAEEQQLAQRIQQGDQQAADQLATANLRYVVTIARQYLPQLSALNAQHSLLFDDLVSEGNIGLMKAALKFKPQSSNLKAQSSKRFVTFAAPYIRTAIEQALSTLDAQRLTLSTDESLPLGSNNNFTLLNVLEDKDAPQADAPLERDTLSAELLNAASVLNERERAVITRLFGIGCERLTMIEAAMELGLKRERVRQIRDVALRKMKKAGR